QFESLVRADEAGSQRASSPAWNQSQKTFGEGDSGDRLRYCSVIAVKAYFKTAAESRSIVCSQRRDFQIHYSLHRCMAFRADSATLLEGIDKWDLHQVRPRGENIVLAAEHHTLEFFVRGNRIHGRVQ